MTFLSVKRSMTKLSIYWRTVFVQVLALDWFVLCPWIDHLFFQVFWHTWLSVCKQWHILGINYSVRKNGLLCLESFGHILSHVFHSFFFLLGWFIRSWIRFINLWEISRNIVLADLSFQWKFWYSCIFIFGIVVILLCVGFGSLVSGEIIL